MKQENNRKELEKYIKKIGICFYTGHVDIRGTFDEKMYLLSESQLVSIISKLLGIVKESTFSP